MSYRVAYTERYYRVIFEQDNYNVSLLDRGYNVAHTPSYFKVTKGVEVTT